MPHGHDEDKETFCKVVSFWSIGILTLVYCIGELGAGVYLQSLTLLSDGFHNLSDVASLYVAYWALKASKRSSGDDMTYGWARTELIGGLINGCALLSLCVYIVLEAIPRFISAVECSVKETPDECDGNADLSTHSNAKIFIYVAAAGLAVNTIGTIVFSLSGHGHSHAGGGHNHSHGGDDDHGHSHKKKKKHGHSHGVTPGGDDHGHSHKKKEKKHGHGHGHSHGEPEKERLLGGHISDDEEDHHHAQPSQDGEEMNTVKNYLDEDHGHSHKKKEKKHGHGHGHDHGHGHGDKKEKKKKVDMNVRAVFLHYLGDMLSSFFVLVTGLLFYFFSPQPDGSHSHSSSITVPKAEQYLLYLDPTASLLIVVLILFTTVPMVKRCAVILLQSTPPDVDLNELRRKLHEIPEVHGVHDLHVWQLVDGLAISSVHIVVDYHVSFTDVQHKVKKVFHKMGIHSTAVQPEFVDIQNHMRRDYCETNCVKECEEDWCCKKNAELELTSVSSLP